MGRGTGFAWVPGRTARAPRPQADDGRFTDEEILTVVRAGEAGVKLADLCEATGITVDTYYAWKARYSGLTVEQVQALRVRTRTRKRRVTLLACAVGVTAASVGALSVTRQTDASPIVPSPAPPKTDTPILPAPPAPPRAPVPGPAQAAEPPAAPPATAARVAPTNPSVPAPPAIPAAPPAPSGSASAAAPTVVASADPSGYSVQVAAVPDLQQARAELERLTAAGYPAHITTRTVNRVEMYRVRVGPLATRDVAARIAERLEHDGYPSPWVTH